jgi:tetratricopeptide (TPR) repeat protein
LRHERVQGAGLSIPGGDKNGSQADLRAAYGQALASLRTGRAATAERQLRAIQARAPGDVNSLRLLGVALLDQGKTAAAIETLERTVSLAPNFWYARTDLARSYRLDGRHDAARETLRCVLNEAPTLAAAWLAYGDVLVDQEKYTDAKFAFEQARHFDPQRARIEQATALLAAMDQRSAEKIFREILRADASHVGGLCGLAAISLGAGNTRDSERLLRHALKQSAHAPVARRGMGHTLLAAGRLAEAEGMIQELLKFEPENPQNWVALGTVYTRLLRQRDALAAFEQAARLNPTLVTLRLSIGHLHKTLGQRAECEKAYHECLAIDPGFGDAYWSLADLKTYNFSDGEIEAMRGLLADRPGAGDAQLHFALGRAHEQRADYPGAFAHYAAGNGLRRKTSPFDIAQFEAKSRRVISCFDDVFFRQREGMGCPDSSPIFIVGLPRSGSTLVEQILASHSSVEGTMELPNILTMVREFDQHDGQTDAYPESVPPAGGARLASLGARYLEETRPIRSGRPRFIDKMPNNFSHVGLIHAILPNATIIDARRHPMDACLSTFKQHFAEGQSFSYDLNNLVRYYRSYLSLMDHWDAVLPGRVLHLQYEELVRDPNAHIRRLLEHCELPFEDACLNFHETTRPVRTASSEQVRQPMYASGIGYWKHFAKELDPLRRSLGDCLERFTSIG